MKVITFVLLAIFVLLCMQNNYIVDAGNIRGTPSNTEEDVSPTSNAKGISDFRPKPHSPEDVTEENIRNKRSDIRRRNSRELLHSSNHLRTNLKILNDIMSYS